MAETDDQDLLETQNVINLEKIKGAWGWPGIRSVPIKWSNEEESLQSTEIQSNQEVIGDAWSWNGITYVPIKW